MITATWNDGIKGFEFLEPYVYARTDAPVVLTQVQWEKCLADWPNRYLTGGARYQQHSRTLKDYLFHRPGKITVTPFQAADAYIECIRFTMQAQQTILLNGVYHKVIIQ